jgi:hypothetical protein
MRRSILFVACLLLFGAAVRADDLKLKDGSKITGTIVGFDNDSFKVQTTYGFALVRRDQVVSITVADSAKGESQKQSTAADEKSAAKPNAEPANATQNASLNKPQRITAPTTLAAPAPKAASTATPVTAPAIPAQAGAPASPALASVAAAPAAPPKPGPIREEVDGTTYVNETYGFRMYKPPDWEVIAGARSLLPGTITAMGTLDETTYLLIGEAPAGKSLAGDIDATDQRLRSLMDNFRPLGETRINVSGTQAIERRFRGSVDQKDWSGTVVFLSRDGELYTIFGMTLAQTDLVQIQENVIARAISSLHFVQ